MTATRGRLKREGLDTASIEVEVSVFWDQSMCPLRKKRAENPGLSSNPSNDAKGSDEAASDVVADETTDKDMATFDYKLTVLATPEPGGADIDSFVNKVLRFRERCSVPCLRTHIFSNPNVLGLLNCFA